MCNTYSVLLSAHIKFMVKKVQQNWCMQINSVFKVVQKVQKKNEVFLTKNIKKLPAIKKFTRHPRFGGNPKTFPLWQPLGNQKFTQFYTKTHSHEKINVG